MTNLFLCSTQFQIISILSIVENEKHLLETDNDIIIEAEVPYAKKWRDVLIKTKLFRSILILDASDTLKSLTIKKRILLSRKLRGKIKIKWIDAFLITLNVKRKFLEFEINKSNDQSQPFKIKNYDVFFIASLTTIGKALYDQFIYEKTKICVYDEGMGSYTGHTWEKIKYPNAVYLFSPDIITIQNYIEQTNLKKISVIRNRKILKVINEEFNITKEEMPEIIFFDQFLGMPSIHNSGPTDWERSSYTSKKIKLLQEINRVIGSDKIKIKLHPASFVKIVLDFYKKNNIPLLLSDQKMPFELLLLSSNKKPRIIITIFSSAALTPVTLGIDKNINIIFLWRLFKTDHLLHSFTKNDSLSKLFFNIKKQYPNNIHIPESEFEFIHILAKIYNSDLPITKTVI